MVIKHVMLVEPEREARARYTVALEREGYSVGCAHSVEHALRLLATPLDGKASYYAVIIDLDVGDSGGFEVLEAAMRLAWPPTVVLVATHTTIETALAALRGGAADYLCKPVAPAQLVESLARGLERRAALIARAAALVRSAEIVTACLGPSPNTALLDSQQDGPTMRVGPLALDLARRSARWRGRALHLTPIEHALLRYMAAAPDQVHSYQAIVQWTHDLSLSESEAKLLIKSHVRNLRRKIDAGYLLHMKGAGYMLVTEPYEDIAGEADTMPMLRERVAVA